MDKRKGKRLHCADLDQDFSQSQGSNNILNLTTSKAPRHSGQATKTSEYVEGSIVRIKLKKFLTYESVELKPGPYLNVVIGPNGTGKSAIVCAICLGLAGKTSWLGRASDPKDYIRHGADKAEIELELYNPLADKSNYIIHREISRHRSSHWWINGRSSSQKQVEETVSSLNIQVGNLCQFLPQEKVADFARMSQQELLENTEKSIGETGLYENHQKLKGARENSRLLESEVLRLTETLVQNRQRNARLEQDVKSYHDRKNFLAKVDILKIKKPWQEYHNLKEEFERAKDERIKKTEELKHEEKQLAPLQKKHEKLKTEKEKMDEGIRNKSQRIRSKAKDLEEQNKNMHNTADEIEHAKADYDSKVKDEEDRKRRMQDLQDQLHALETGLAKVDGKNTERIAAGLEQVSVNMRKAIINMSSVQSDGQSLQREINGIKAEKRASEVHLKEIRNVSNRRMEVLRRLHQHTYDAVLWLRANKDRFTKTIHEPMIISLNVKNPANAKLVETRISFNDLRSFVCEDSTDLEEFMRVMKNEQRLRVNAVQAPIQASNTFKSKYPISYYKKYGFHSYLQELFTCHESVMSYLCLMYRMHIIPVGTQEVAQHAEKIIRDCPDLSTFYTPDTQFSVGRSRYTNNVSTRNQALREARALADSINVDREQELVTAIQEYVVSQRNKEDNYKQLQTESDVLEGKINQLREEKRSLLKQKDERKNLENQITTKRQRIQQVMREAVDLKAEKRCLQTLLERVVLNKCNYLENMKQANRACVDLAKERVFLSLQLETNIKHFTVIEVQLRNGRQKFETLEQEVEELKEHVKDLKHQAREKLMETKQVAGVGVNDSLEDRLKERGVWEDIQNAPKHLDELEAEIHSMQARAEAMFEVDEGVIRDYEKRLADIASMERTLACKQSSCDSHQEDVGRLRDAWLGPLQSLMTRINENFSFFFSRLQCCGEVSLNIPENSEDYEKYGVCIKVKFRDDENLRELTATHQSGGERSVSTVLYMMALQELTRCPFRCVDEINQGMDPRNERKVFQLVVQTVCKTNSSQYFLLTPKLLPDLEYGDHMTVLCVYNGPYMMDHKEWDLGTFIRKRSQLD